MARPGTSTGGLIQGTMLSGAKVQSKEDDGFWGWRGGQGRSQKHILGTELGLGGEREGLPINISISVSWDQPGSLSSTGPRGEGRRLLSADSTALPLRL